MSESSEITIPANLQESYSNTIDHIYETHGKFEVPDNFTDNIKRVLKPMVWYEDDSIYVGEWQAESNIKHGIGVMMFADGTVYEGQWRKDTATGIGRLVYSNGDFYTG